MAFDECAKHHVPVHWETGVCARCEDEEKMSNLNRRRTMLDIIKGLDLDGHDLEALVEYSSFARQFTEEFKTNGLEVPTWLTEKNEELASVIKTKRRDSVLAALKSAEAKLDSLKSAEDKRADLKADIERLRALL